MKAAPKTRIFLVGCPRSGTTLLQSFVASHPDVNSFPESHFFIHLLRGRRRLYRILGLASERARARFENFLHEIDHTEMQSYLPKQAVFVKQYANAFIKVLDTLTEMQGKQIWIEKTPEHVLYIEQIEKIVPGAKFIHIIRNGVDVVASLYEVARLYPEDWHGPWDIDKCIRKWSECVEASIQHLHKSNHTLVSYEQLIAEPNAVLSRLGEFLEIELDYEALQKRKDVVKQIVLGNESWKASVSAPINKNTNKKINELFSQDEREYITSRISEIDLRKLSLHLPEISQVPL